MDSKFYGLYRAFCVGRIDPEGRYRIQVRVPSVSGDAVLWAEPCLPLTYFEEDKRHIPHPPHSHTGSITDEGGTYSFTTSINAEQIHDVHKHYPPGPLTTYPLLGQGVWVQYEGGDASYPVWVGLYTRSFY